jgi:hypothetical protein
VSAGASSTAIQQRPSEDQLQHAQGLDLLNYSISAEKDSPKFSLGRGELSIKVSLQHDGIYRNKSFQKKASVCMSRIDLFFLWHWRCPPVRYPCQFKADKQSESDEWVRQLQEKKKDARDSFVTTRALGR